MAERKDPGDEEAAREATVIASGEPLRGIVFDSGALDDLLEERLRTTFLDATRAEEVQLVVPLMVVTEFLLGHPNDRVRADRVLAVLEQTEATPQMARRAAWLLGHAARGLKRTPSLADGIIAAFAETHGAVATNDPADMRALAAAGTGFDVYTIGELLEVMR